MSQPTAAAVHAVDVPLTNVSVAYIQNEGHFVAGQVFPRIPVTKQSDRYYTYPKGDWFRDEAEVRADATESAGSGFTLSDDTYFCDVLALHKDIGDQARANQDAAIDLERDTTEFLTQRMLLSREIRWNSEYMSTGIWATTTTSTALWDDYTNGDPISDIEVGKETILANTGYEPNTLVLAYSVWRQLKHHPDIVDRYKHTTNQSITTEMFARVVEIDRVLVTKAIQNTALEGSTAPSMSFVTGNDALLCWVPPSPGLLIPSPGYTFEWTGMSPAGLSAAISRFRMEHLMADRVEAHQAYDFKLVASDLGYFFDEIVS
jgi:hypothetical protein